MLIIIVIFLLSKQPTAWEDKKKKFDIMQFLTKRAEIA